MTKVEFESFSHLKKFGNNLFYFDKIDSTNIKAKQLLEENVAEGTIVIAEEQTAGRGRLNRKWISESQKNLTFSVIIKPSISPEHIGILSIYAGLAVAEALKKMFNIIPVCKWPNDVYQNGKKVCGILSEAVFKNDKLYGVVIGIGINVNQSVFPDELMEKATSIRNITGKEQNRFELLNSVLERLECYYENIQTGELKNIMERWKENSTMFEKEVIVNQNGNMLTGTAVRLADDGGLIINTNNGEVKVLAGDVSIC